MVGTVNMRERLGRWVEGRAVSNFIIGVIVFNAGLLGMETAPALMEKYGTLILFLDRVCLFIFIAEITLKIIARGVGFFRNGWNVFDFTVVAIALVPAVQGLSVLRALRILRVLRVLSVAPRLRRVVEGFITALPGMGSVFLLMTIIFYIGSVIATKLFSDQFPEWFGSLPASAYSLFQIMTLESWSMGIVRPVMEAYPYAWMFFVPFSKEEVQPVRCFLPGKRPFRSGTWTSSWAVKGRNLTPFTCGFSSRTGPASSLR